MSQMKQIKGFITVEIKTANAWNLYYVIIELGNMIKHGMRMYSIIEIAIDLFLLFI
jgi:hypothetical protein